MLNNAQKDLCTLHNGERRARGGDSILHGFVYNFDDFCIDLCARVCYNEEVRYGGDFFGEDRFAKISPMPHGKSGVNRLRFQTNFKII